MSLLSYKAASEETDQTMDSAHPGIRVVLWVFAALALVYLIVAHPAHLLGWLPFLVIMACPLMHLFMHRGHHSRHRVEGTEKREERS